MGLALLASIVIHVLLALWLMRLTRPTATDNDVAMQVVLHDALPVEPALPTPPLPPMKPVAAGARTFSTSSNADSHAKAIPERAAASDGKESAAPALRLFNADGSIRLPPASAPAPFESALAHGRELMQRGHNLLHCRRERFDLRLTPEEAGQQAAKQAAVFHLMFDDPSQLQAVRDGIMAADMAASHDETVATRERLDRVCDDDPAPGKDGGTDDRGKPPA